MVKAFRKKASLFAKEIETLRFGLKPSAVYFNPTERCNLNCAYCYIPEDMRRKGQHMSPEKLLESLAILKRYFRTTVPKGSLPQIVFHGAEPLLNREAVFAGIERYSDDFRFGIQTNATLLDEAAIAFLRGHEVSIGISLDAPTAAIADRTRSNWEGQGVFQQVIQAMDRLKGYPGWSVICTVSTREPAAPDEARRFPPRARSAHLPDEHPPLHAAALAEREAGRRAGGQVFPEGPGSHARACTRRRGGS